MEQHPIPQPITSYEFRLVGDMTLKQFGKLIVGIILALIVYAINPPYLLKWFLILLFAGLGVLSAFVPFQGRPIDTWIIAFFKRIYSPTQYIWKPKENINLLNKIVPEINTPSQTLSQTTPHTPITRLSPSSGQTISPLSINISKSSSQEKTTPPKFINFPTPATPTIPNLIVGFVRNKEGKLIEDAILEIRDEQGIPVRAFKTNKLGQFISSTPLHSGIYEIETEKEGYKFDIIKIKLEGKILPPIEIISK